MIFEFIFLFIVALVVYVFVREEMDKHKCIYCKKKKPEVDNTLFDDRQKGCNECNAKHRALDDKIKADEIRRLLSLETQYKGGDGKEEGRS